MQNSAAEKYTNEDDFLKSLKIKKKEKAVLKKHRGNRYMPGK